MDLVSKFKDIAGEKWKTKHSLVLSPTTTIDDVRLGMDLVPPGGTATFVGRPSVPGRLQRVAGNLDMDKFQLVRVAKNDKVLWAGETSVNSLMALEELALADNERFYLTFVNKSYRAEPVYRMLPTILMGISGDARHLVPMTPVKERPSSEGTFQVDVENAYVNFKASADKKFKPNRLIVEADDYDGLFVTSIVIGKENVLSKGDVPAAVFSPEHGVTFEMCAASVGVEISVHLTNSIANVKKVKVTVEGMAEG